MSVFTDDNLKRLEWRFTHEGKSIEVDVSEGESLLARLEAAEKVIRTFDCAYKFVNTDICKCGEMHDEALEAWRKSCGK